jgi:hypothetical protein
MCQTNSLLRYPLSVQKSLSLLLLLLYCAVSVIGHLAVDSALNELELNLIELL